MITDLDMLKQIMVKDFSNFMDREVGVVLPAIRFIASL